jgi:hypothetical protein
MTTRLLFLVLMVVMMPVQARMYQWIDPDTGTTQLSGKPPAWYRSAENGPRVIVFEKGRVVDDTNISVSGSLQEELRRQALTKAVEDKEKASQMAKQAAELKSKLGTQLNDELSGPVAREREVSLPDVSRTRTPEPEPEQVEQPVYKELTEDDLRALISDWEQQKTQQSKEKIGIEASTLE